MRGRPSKFDITLSAKIAALYGQGKTDKEVANAIGVSLRTIHYWKSTQPDFLHTLKEAKSVADDLVEASLFRRATGYTHPEEKIFCAFGQVTRVKTNKHYPPEVTAQIFWLKNRRPELWREKDAPQDPTPPEKKETEKVSFHDFCVNAGYPAPYIKQEEMREFCFLNDQEEPTLLLGARKYGKTDYITILGVAYDIYCNPLSTSNLIITKTRARNAAIIEEIANALIKNGVALSVQNSSCIRVAGMIGKDHSVEALPIRSSFRGRHPKRILMDDPTTEEDISEAMRKLVKRKYDEAMKLSKNLKIIGQPAHAFDLYAQLREIVKKMEVPHGTIPELDDDLNLLKMAGVDERSIEMSYHLRVPKDGSSIFADIKSCPKLPLGTDGSVAFIDPANEGEDNTAISIFCPFMNGIAVEGHQKRMAWWHYLPELIPILKARNVKRVCFETNATGTQPLDQLRQVLGPLGIGVVGVHSDTNKHATIQAAGALSDKIFLSKESDRSYTDNVVQYEYGARKDDAPDSLARGLQWMGLIKGKK